MKPKLITELVPIQYWECGTYGHRHKREDVALACIAKHEQRTTSNTGSKQWTNEALAAVLSDHRAGAKKCDLAKRLGLSSQRVAEVLAKAERLERLKELMGPFYLLSARTRGLLIAEDLVTVEAVRDALADGRLDAVPNIGEVTKSEVRHWLAGLPSNAEAAAATINEVANEQILPEANETAVGPSALNVGLDDDPTGMEHLLYALKHVTKAEMEALRERSPYKNDAGLALGLISAAIWGQKRGWLANETGITQVAEDEIIALIIAEAMFPELRNDD